MTTLEMGAIYQERPQSGPIGGNQAGSVTRAPFARCLPSATAPGGGGNIGRSCAPLGRVPLALGAPASLGVAALSTEAGICATVMIVFEPVNILGKVKGDAGGLAIASLPVHEDSARWSTPEGVSSCSKYLR